MIDVLILNAHCKREFAAVEFLNFVKKTAEYNKMSINDTITYLLSTKQTSYNKSLLNILRRHYPKDGDNFTSVFDANNINISKISVHTKKYDSPIKEFIKEKPIQHRPADVEGKAGTLKIG
jgi:hypothetical protein